MSPADVARELRARALDCRALAASLAPSGAGIAAALRDQAERYEREAARLERLGEARDCGADVARAT